MSPAPRSAPPGSPDRPPAFVRSAAPRDLPAVSALLTRTWHDTYDKLYGSAKVGEITSSWHSVEALQRQLDAPRSEFLVADDGAEIVGMAFARMTDRETAHLFQLYVDPIAQGTGLGRDVLAELVTCFPEAKRMELEVASGNARAIGFYGHHGFAERERGTENGIETVVLERPLEPYSLDPASLDPNA